MFTFFKYDDLDARIGLAIQGGMLALVMLAEGCSRSGKPGAYTYKRRNPDRRKAANSLFEPVDNKAAGLTWLVGPVTVRAGKAANLPEQVDGSGVLAAFRRGGNYAFHAWCPIESEGAGFFESVAEVAVTLGLVPCDNRPVAVTWPAEVA